MSLSRKSVLLAVKTAAAVVLIAAVGRHFARLLDRPELREHPLTLRPEYLIPAGILYLGAHTLWGTFWVQLLRSQGANLPWLTGIRAYFVSQFGKYVPGKVWVLALRVGMLRPLGLSPGVVAVTGTYETLTSMGAGALIAVCLLPWTGPAVGLDLNSEKGVALLGLAGLPVVVGVIHRLAAKSLVSPSPWLLARGVVQDAVGWVLLGFSLWLTVLAVLPDGPGLTPDVFLQDLGAVALSYVAGFVVLVSPGGLGAREFILQLALTPQLEPSTGSAAGGLAAVVALVLRFVWTVFEVIFSLGLWWFARPRLPGERSDLNSGEPAAVAGRDGDE
jgi:glycosyltransferase 2 family protein